MDRRAREGTSHLQQHRPGDQEESGHGRRGIPREAEKGSAADLADRNRAAGLDRDAPPVEPAERGDAVTHMVFLALGDAARGDDGVMALGGGGKTAADFFRMMDLIRERVLHAYGIELEEEVIVWKN